VQIIYTRRREKRETPKHPGVKEMLARTKILWGKWRERGSRREEREEREGGEGGRRKMRETPKQMLARTKIL
jgi:hypothetical protein